MCIVKATNFIWLVLKSFADPVLDQLRRRGYNADFILRLNVSRDRQEIKGKKL